MLQPTLYLHRYSVSSKENAGSMIAPAILSDDSTASDADNRFMAIM